MTNKEIINSALSKLKGNWGNAVVIGVAFIAMSLMIFLCHLVNFVAYRVMGYGTVSLKLHNVSILQIASTTALNLAFLVVLIMAYSTAIRQFIDMSQGRGYNLSRNLIMKRKRHFFKISVVPFFTKIFIIFLSMIPGILGYDSVKNLSELATQQESLSVFTLLFFMMSVFMIILSAFITLNSILSLHLLGTLILLNPLMPITQAVALCFKRSEGNKIRIISFYIYFLKYLWSCILVYPIIIVFPFYLMCNLVLCQDILGKDLSKDNFFDSFDSHTTPV